MHRRNARLGVPLGLSAVAALAVLAAGATGAASAAGTAGTAGSSHRSLASHPSASSLHGWYKVSGGPAVAVSAIGLMRKGFDLQAVWTGRAGSDETLDTRIVHDNGSPASAPIQVLGWTIINPYPQAIPFPSIDNGQAIVFSGERSTDTTDTYNGSAEYLLTSTDGTHWSLSNDQTSATNSSGDVSGSLGADATYADNNVAVVYEKQSAQQVSYHEGYEPLAPTTSPDPTATNAGGDVLWMGDGWDGHADQVWTAWYSLSQAKSTAGISAQRILPTPGTRVQAPDTAVKSGGSYQSQEPNQRVDVAARDPLSGGGLYVAYAVGYPSATHVALWRLGASKALVFKAGTNIHLADAAVGLNGRMWVIWKDSNDGAVHAARTNRAATRLGATCTATTPGKTSDVWSLAGEGTAGSDLQLFVNAGQNQEATSIYTTNVKPCLTVHISPGRVRPGHHVKVTVTDAGAPVSGATVSLLGDAKKTNHKGKAVFRVSRHAGSGKKAVKVRADEYQKKVVHIRVK